MRSLKHCHFTNIRCTTVEQRNSYSFPTFKKYAQGLAMAVGHGRQVPTLAILPLKNLEKLNACSDSSVPGIS